MQPNTAIIETDAQSPRHSNSEIQAVQITVAALSERLDKPVCEILANLRKLALRD